MQNNENFVQNQVEKDNPELLGMIMNPREQFERIRENPKIVVALIVVTLLALIAALFSFKGMEQILEAELGAVSEEEMMILTIVAQITAVVTALFTPIVTVLISSAIYMLIAKIAQKDVTFKQLFSMFFYIAFINIGLSGFVNGFFSMFVKNANPEVALTSLNSIIGAEGVMGELLSSIEVFSIWGIVLTAMGLQIVAQFSKGLAWGTVIAFYIISIGILIGLTMISQTVGV